MDISTVSSDLFLMTKQSEFNLSTGPFRLGITPSGAAMLSYKTNTFCRSKGNAAFTLRDIHNTDCWGSCVFLLFSIFECLLSITPSEILKFYISTRNPSSAENHSAQKQNYIDLEAYVIFIWSTHWTIGTNQKCINWDRDCNF